VENELDGKVAIVTGASSGIGEATSEALAAESATVVAARREERLTGHKERVQDNGGRLEVVRRAEDEFGGVDILVNNAGVMLLSKVEKSLSDQWRQMFDVNVLGLLYATDAAIGAMRRRGGGHIVNISSVAGHVRGAGSTRGRSSPSTPSPRPCEELIEDKIRVTMVEPGAVETELATHHRRGSPAGGSGPSSTRHTPGRGFRLRRGLLRHPAREDERQRDPDPADRAGLLAACGPIEHEGSTNSAAEDRDRQACTSPGLGEGTRRLSGGASRALCLLDLRDRAVGPIPVGRDVGARLP
jgi:NADP-dependent 3-hydroxy acid dehydrogenase YdfG